MAAKRLHPDVQALQQLMEWARQKGYRIAGPLELGELKLVIADTRQAAMGDPIGQMDALTAPDAGLPEPEDGTGG